MLTKEDKSWVAGNFATKKEMYLIRNELKDDISEVKELVKQTLNSVNKFTGKVADLEQENKMGAVTLRRHGINIRELAKATDTVLSK